MSVSSQVLLHWIIVVKCVSLFWSISSSGISEINNGVCFRRQYRPKRSQLIPLWYRLTKWSIYWKKIFIFHLLHHFLLEDTQYCVKWLVNGIMCVRIWWDLEHWKYWCTNFTMMPETVPTFRCLYIHKMSSTMKLYWIFLNVPRQCIFEMYLKRKRNSTHLSSQNVLFVRFCNHIETF